jgi:hypothetical protein
MSSPTLRIHFESEICELRPESTGDLKLRVKIPADYTANHLILLLKTKSGKKFIGPTMMLFAKIIKRRSSQEEFSSFDVEDDFASQNSLERELKQISAGVDVYSEQQLLHMASILSDEGMGTFDRCMMTLRTLRGDIEQARKILSEIIFA